jgi:release factor glutamine methyltransferase
VQADLLEAVHGPVDVIVANPPYVPSGVELSPDITRYEPAVALYSGVKGLTALDRLIQSARGQLVDGGLFVVEFGFGQDEHVEPRARAAGWGGIEFIADLQSIPRVAVLSK